MTDADCDEFPETHCRSEPVNPGLDPGTRRVPYRQWKEGDTLLKSCWCKEGRVRIPESRGCYDPIRKVMLVRKVALFSQVIEYGWRQKPRQTVVVAFWGEMAAIALLFWLIAICAKV